VKLLYRGYEAPIDAIYCRLHKVKNIAVNLRFIVH